VKFNLSASRARSGREAAAIFRMTWPRWTFTVISLMPISNLDLFVQTAGHHHGHHLAFAGGERLEARPQGGDCPFVLQPRTISRKAQLNRVQQILIAERLGQELDRSSLYRLDGQVMKMIGTLMFAAASSR
jgi:hypothetical protein